MEFKKNYTLIIIGAIAMFNLCGCFSNLKYEKYSSKDPEINITMDYISGWLYSEHRGAYNSYAQVLFYEKADKDKVSKAGVSVNARNATKVEVDPATIESMADDIKSKRMKLEDFSMISRSDANILQEKAIVMEFEYKTLDKIYDVDAKPISVKEKIIIFKKVDKFYTIRYENTKEDFDKLNKAFSHMVRSIRFKK